MTQVSNLKAAFRNGQVFITWDQATNDSAVTYRVTTAARPITPETLSDATCLAHDIENCSAKDWWYERKYLKKRPPKGYIVAEGKPRLAPCSGLFVHTVEKDDPAIGYYAVTAVADAVEDTRIVPGVNSLTEGITQRQQPIQPVWQGRLIDKPKPGSASGEPLMLRLHGAGGFYPSEWMLFGDKRMGWRDGIPWTFCTRGPDRSMDHPPLFWDQVGLTLMPTDYAVIGRQMRDKVSPRLDYFTGATKTWWFGYNENIRRPDKMKDGIAKNYTEERLLYLIAWAQEYFDTDRDRNYASGVSMGGCGCVSFALRHPEIFSYIYAHVPIVSYGKALETHSERSFLNNCGSLLSKCYSGQTLQERLDGTRFVQNHRGALPFLVIDNGRNDGSIPWPPVPDFYRSLNSARQGFAAWWDEGQHSTAGGRNADRYFRRNFDPDFISQFSLKKSYLAFSNCSLDANPGNGGPTSGDPVGDMNASLAWKDIKDEAGGYEAVVKVVKPGAKLPAGVDVTLRRVQRFEFKTGDDIMARNVGCGSGKTVETRTLQVDDAGLLTYPGFTITEPEGNRLLLGGK